MTSTMKRLLSGKVKEELNLQLYYDVHFIPLADKLSDSLLCFSVLGRRNSYLFGFDDSANWLDLNSSFSHWIWKQNGELNLNEWATLFREFKQCTNIFCWYKIRMQITKKKNIRIQIWENIKLRNFTAWRLQDTIYWFIWHICFIYTEK